MLQQTHLPQKFTFIKKCWKSNLKKNLPTRKQKSVLIMQDYKSAKCFCHIQKVIFEFNEAETYQALSSNYEKIAAISFWF